jgi:hypothetical protein
MKITYAVKRAIKNHRLIPTHHNLNDLMKALSKDKEAGKYPKAAESAITTIQQALWKKETMNGSQLIKPGMRNLFDVEI